MGRYIVHGADSTTGQDLSIEIYASTPHDAERIAQRKGMFVSAVEPVEVQEPPPPAPAPVVVYAPRPEPPPVYAPPSYAPAPMMMRPRPRTAFEEIYSLGRIGCGVVGGMLALGCLVTMCTRDEERGPAQGRDSARLRRTEPQPRVEVRPRAPAEITYVEADMPVAAQESPARLLGAGVVEGELRLGIEEFERVEVDGEPHLRWRLHVSNFGNGPITTGISASLFELGGREMWRGGGWIVSIPPGTMQVIERTEPCTLGTIPRYSTLRFRRWSP